MFFCSYIISQWNERKKLHCNRDYWEMDKPATATNTTSVTILNGVSLDLDLDSDSRELFINDSIVASCFNSQMCVLQLKSRKPSYIQMKKKIAISDQIRGVYVFSRAVSLHVFLVCVFYLTALCKCPFYLYFDKLFTNVILIICRNHSQLMLTFRIAFASTFWWNCTRTKQRHLTFIFCITCVCHDALKFTSFFFFILHSICVHFDSYLISVRLLFAAIQSRKSVVRKKKGWTKYCSTWNNDIRQITDTKRALDKTKSFQPKSLNRLFKRTTELGECKKTIHITWNDINSGNQTKMSLKSPQA